MSDNTIPPITEPMGVHWQQPPVDAIAIDDTHAAMTRATFERLLEYSTSRPSGVYAGKMWRAHERDDIRWTERWHLFWYGIVPADPRMCSINHREILIVEP